MALDLRDTREGLTLRVRVQPRASKDALGGEREGALVVRLTRAAGRGRGQRGARALPGQGARRRASRRAHRAAAPRAATSSWLSPALDAATARERLGA